jgi:non-ribosomal peptide synthetase component F
MLSQGNLLAYYQNALSVFKPTREDRFIQITELTFDLSMHDIFLAWGVGATLFPVPDSFYGSLNFYSKVLKFADENQLTFWMSVPSIGSISNELGFLKTKQLNSLQCTIFCGEPLSKKMTEAWKKAAPQSQIFNLYGPTEATIGLTYFECHHEKRDILPIGKAFPTEQAIILDDQLETLDSGQIGELYLEGNQVVTGYWNNFAKTQERFIELTIRDQKKIWYRTGDLAYVDPDGILQYVGRRDDQLKIRGSRVEKLEIENILREIAETDSVAVVPWPLAADGTILGVVAFISGIKKSTEMILQDAKINMPEYMIPKEIYILDKLPLNQNGKVDYKALREKLNV